MADTGIDWDHYDHGPGSEEHKHKMAAEGRAYDAKIRAEREVVQQQAARVPVLEAANKRLRHIICVLRWHAMMFFELAAYAESNVRIQDGRLEVWCVGEWTDVVKANAEADAIIDGDEAKEPE